MFSVALDQRSKREFWRSLLLYQHLTDVLVLLFFIETIDTHALSPLSRIHFGLFLGNPDRLSLSNDCLLDRVLSFVDDLLLTDGGGCEYQQEP